MPPPPLFAANNHIYLIYVKNYRRRNAPLSILSSASFIKSCCQDQNRLPQVAKSYFSFFTFSFFHFFAFSFLCIHKERREREIYSSIASDINCLRASRCLKGIASKWKRLRRMIKWLLSRGERRERRERGVLAIVGRQIPVFCQRQHTFTFSIHFRTEHGFLFEIFQKAKSACKRHFLSRHEACLYRDDIFFDARRRQASNKAAVSRFRLFRRSLTTTEFD